MREIKKMKEGLGDVVGPVPEDPPAPVPDAPEVPSSATQSVDVSVEVLPAEGSAAALQLRASTPGGPTFTLAAGLSRAQARECAARLLMLADRDSAGTERTILSVTPTHAWSVPGQYLVVRFTPEPHYQWGVPPLGAGGANGVVAAPQRRLIVPGR